MFQRYFKTNTSLRPKILKFKIIDSDFNLIIKCPKWKYIGYGSINLIPKIIKEYENRNYGHLAIVKNLFLFNMFVLTQDDWLDMKTLLKNQYYHVDVMYNNVNFNLKYYNDLVKYTKKMLTLI